MLRNPNDACNSCDPAAETALQLLPHDVSTSSEVVARGRRWRLHAVLTHDDCRELHLSAAGLHKTLLWPFDRPVPTAVERRIRAVRPRRLLQALAALDAASLDPFTPRAATGDVRIAAFQLAPCVAIARGEARLLLADEVGLGKTIQAGWIVADLIAREPGARVLIAVPSSVRRQWLTELSVRFRVEAADVDARWMRATIADRPPDVSPWAAPGVYVASIDYLKRADVAASAARHVWDALVVDEAHTATAPTERHLALTAIATHARRVIAVTATPFSGDAAGFASMTGLGGAEGEPAPLMFRRFREDVGDPRRRRHRFSTVRLTRSEIRLQRLLERYSRMVWNEAPGDAAGARLAVTVLRKRALSSAAAAERSLRRRRNLLSALTPAPRQLKLFDDEDDLQDDLLPAALGAPGLVDVRREDRWLRTLVEASGRAAGDESKLRFLMRLLSRLRGESAVVFTEYRDTLLQLAVALPAALQLHGGLSARERAAVQDRFNREGGLLLATDAAAEGLNLQQRCRVVVNYELPWNPARLEQRIGRVDRIGQRFTVHAITLTARDTAEDMVIANLTRRLARIVATLGSQDRLGVFLDDARIAGLVIGGGDQDVQPEPRFQAADPAIVRRAAGVDHQSVAAADLLERQKSVGADHTCLESDVLVSAVPARRDLPPGTSVVLRVSARTTDGQVVARTMQVVHINAAVARPSTARAARAVASAALDQLPDPVTTLPDLTPWFAAVCLIHGDAAGRSISRGTALCGKPSLPDEVQPGLFDSRAVDAAARQAEEAGETDAEHRRRIAWLRRSRPLHLTCEPAAVLIAWS